MEIKTDNQQLVIDFEGGLTARYTSLRDCVATGVYKRSLGRMAIELNESPGNLSVKLSENPARHLSVEDFELYLEKSHDLTPIYYLCEKFLADAGAKQDAAHAEAKRLIQQLTALIGK